MEGKNKTVRYMNIFASHSTYEHPSPLIFSRETISAANERQVAEKIVKHFTLSSAFFLPPEMRQPLGCMTSAHEALELMASLIARLATDTTLKWRLRTIRYACEEFLRVFDDTDHHLLSFSSKPSHVANSVFNSATNTCHTTIAVQISQIRKTFNV